MSDKLLSELRDLELELQQPAVRRSRERLLALLHPDFYEVGRSGRTYAREDVVRNLLSGQPEAEIRSANFRIALLGPNAGLLTYDSAHVGKFGEECRPTHRVSVWVRSASGWQMRYHQGTPALPLSAG